MKTYQNITCEINESIALLTFNRPEVLNALNTATLEEAHDAVSQIEGDSGVKVVVFTGAGRSFVAGADIEEMSTKTPEQARPYLELGHSLFNKVQQMEKPVIAAINGFCIGGGMEVALSCDIRLASERAQFGLTETILGIIPGWGATQRAARLIGPAVTKELIFAGDLIDAPRALNIGLINQILPHQRVLDCALDMAEKIAKKGVFAVKQAKKVINHGLDLPLKDALDAEIEACLACFATKDQKEGMKAFLEKRAPKFTGD